MAPAEPLPPCPTDAPASRSLPLRASRRVSRCASLSGCAVLLFVLFVLLASFLLSPGGSQFAARFLASVNVSPLLPALDNVFVGALVVPRLLTQRRESPGRLRMIALDLAFAASVRMIHGVHGHAADRRLFPVPPRAAGLSVCFILMIEVADLANRRHALDGKLAHFAGRQLHQREIALFAQQLPHPPRRTPSFSPPPRV